MSVEARYSQKTSSSVTEEKGGIEEESETARIPQIPYPCNLHSGSQKAFCKLSVL